MKFVLDDEDAAGLQTLLVAIRPAREARLLPAGDKEAFIDAVELNCQIWGGVTWPLLPITEDGSLPAIYRDHLLGASIDQIIGYTWRDFRAGALIDELPPIAPRFRDPLAIAFLEIERKDWYKPLTVVELDTDDPWRPIYAACLGRLPVVPDARLLSGANFIPDLTFEHFISVDRQHVHGSLQDLLERLSEHRPHTPRFLSLNGLSRAGTHGTRNWGREGALPQGDPVQKDVGPYIVVVCSDDDIADYALLWNLRAAHDDFYVLPIGIPVGLLDGAAFGQLLISDLLPRHGFGIQSICVTSVSLSVDTLRSLLPMGEAFEAAHPSELFGFGPAPRRARTEVTVWTGGVSELVPTNSEDREFFRKSSYEFDGVSLKLDVEVAGSPFPRGDDVRVDHFSDEYFDGHLSKPLSSKTSESVEVLWPSRFLMLRAVAKARKLEVEPSNAGTVALTLLHSLDAPWELTWLAHGPLLRLLQEMANRQGVSWGKAHLKRSNSADRPAESTAFDASTAARTVDDLLEQPFDKFKDAIGNARAARHWLTWAERHNLIVKGFPIKCEHCGAKMWTPIAGFAPPLHCRGCSRQIDHPFPTDFVNFKYRLSESLRRVFEDDAIGHLLTLRFFNEIFASTRTSAMIGSHPGVDVTRTGEQNRLGEADVLILMSNGDCIPAEVKRAFGGVVQNEVDKLESLADAFDSPWSVIAVTDYGVNAPEEFEAWSSRGSIAGRDRLLLTFYHLLESNRRVLGTDPFAWSPLNLQQIHEREANFPKRIIKYFERGEFSRIAQTMLGSDLA